MHYKRHLKAWCSMAAGGQQSARMMRACFSLNPRPDR